MSALKLVFTGAICSFLALLGTGIGCAPPQQPPIRESTSPGQNSESMSDLSYVQEVKKKHDGQLMAIPGVVGTGISQDADGRHLIEVYVEILDDKVRQQVPGELDGVTVRIVQTGEFEARPADPPPRQQ